MTLSFVAYSPDLGTSSSRKYDGQRSDKANCAQPGHAVAAWMSIACALAVVLAWVFQVVAFGFAPR